MTKMLKSLIVLTFIANLSYSQSLQGNVNCVGAIVEYTYVARAMESPEDTAYGGSHMVTASWPSSAAAAAGQGFTRTLASYEVGDTITTALVPLVTPELLLLAGVAMDVDLNDDGTFTINEGSTYPTTEADNCSTYSTYLRFLKMEPGQVLQVLLIQMIQVCILWDGVYHCQTCLHNLALQILLMANLELTMDREHPWKIGAWST